MKHSEIKRENMAKGDIVHIHSAGECSVGLVTKTTKTLAHVSVGGETRKFKKDTGKEVKGVGRCVCAERIS